MASQLAGTADQYREAVRGQSQKAVLLALVLSIAVSALLILFPPGWLAVMLCLGLAFLAAAWYRPVVALGFIFGTTLLVEQFDFATFRPVTRQVPFFENASRVTGIGGLEASTLEILLIVLTAAVLLRAVVRHSPTPANPVAPPVLVFFLAAGVSLVYGMVSGGAVNIALWELRALAYFGLLVFLVPLLIESERDVRFLLWIAIVAIGVKAAQGAWNYFVVLGSDVSSVRSVTSHEDALFIAWMTILMVGLLAYRTAGGQRAALLLLSPLMAFTFIATDRRAAFVALAFGLIILGAIVATDRAKRALVMRAAIPVLLVFVFIVGVGWGSSGLIGIPASAIRSVVAPDNQEDLDSSYYRRAEEVNLIHAIESNAVFGLGFGRPFQEPGQGGIVDVGFSLQDVISHNALLWIWAKMGTVGFALFWVMMGGIIAFGGLMFRTLRRPYLRVVAATVTCAVAMQIVVSYVDLQLTYARNMVFLGVLVGILSQLPALEKGESAGEVGR